MANTSLSEVYDLFMQNVNDYRLVDLYNTSETDFETYLQAWFEYSIVEFGECSQSLVFDDTTKLFTVVLTTENKAILSMLMVKYWLQKEVADVTQFRLHILDRDFKVFSEASSLREKVAYLNVVKEQCSQMLNSYEYKTLDWTTWLNQDFSGI